MVLAMLVPIKTSSDDDLEEVETAWTDVLEGIDDRPFGTAAVPGCTCSRNSSASSSCF